MDIFRTLHCVATICFVTLACCGCGNRNGQNQPAQEPIKFTVLKVDGMKKIADGKTWMAWPDAVKQALEGLKGISKVEVDVKNDLFRVTASASVTTASMLQAVRDLGYAPTVIPTTDFHAPNESILDSSRTPQLIREAMALAKKQSKPFIVIDFSGDGWIACEKMSSETFANPAVKALIDEHCIFVESNISHDSKIADWLAVEAVPDVCILSQEGVLLDRITGFLSADEFLPRLKRTIP